jgi:hypothetical protein
VFVHCARRVDFVLAFFVALDELVVHGGYVDCSGVGAHDGCGGLAARGGVEEGAAGWWWARCADGRVHCGRVGRRGGTAGRSGGECGFRALDFGVNVLVKLRVCIFGLFGALCRRGLVG